MFCLAQDRHVELEANYNHRIRKVIIPHDVVCKVKSQKDKIRGSFYDFKNDTLFFREYYTNDTFKICWNKMEWMRIKRTVVGSIIYDGWMIMDWGLTGIGLTFLYWGFSAPPGSDAGYFVAPGLALFVISFPQAVVSSVHRFIKYTPDKYQIRRK